MTDFNGCRPYDEWELEALRDDKELAVEYLKLALETMRRPDEMAGALLALRTLADAYGGVGRVATATGLSRESLYRSLSENGNPTLRTLFAVLDSLGLRLSVVPAIQETGAVLANDGASSVESRVA